MAAKTVKPPDILSRVVSDFDTDHEEHRDRVADIDRRYRSYRAVLERRSQAADWTNKQHPAHVFQAVETMAANLVDPNPRWRIRVQPQMDDPERLLELQEGARVNELLLRHQLVLDHWPEKQRPFDLQGLICGVTASKQYWSYREGPRRFRRFYEQPLIDDSGFQYGSVPRQEEASQTDVLRDDPCSEVVDVRHLVFQRGAVSLQRSERITHRVFYPYEHLKRLECRVNGGRLHQGPCEPGRYYHNVDELRDAKGIAQEHYQREQDLFGTRPHRDDVEVLEQWRREGDTLRQVAVADRRVLLQDRASPYWLDHLEHPFPFVVCAGGTPDLFRIPGISEVEVMADLQEMLWTLTNQRLDNLQLINNAIVLVAEDAEDPDAFEFAPGERWLVPRPIKETVDLWAPDVRAAQVSLEAEALLKGDLQNTTGGMPFLSGTASQTIDQQTATGVSIVTSLAQKRLSAKRQQFIWAKARIGEQWCALNQQYVTAPRLVPVIGEDGREAFEEVRPELLQGLYLFETELQDESMVRQERRAEATAKFQIAVSSAQVMAATGRPLNLRAFMDDLLDAYDVADKDRYYASAAPPALPGMEAAPEGQANGVGVTNPALAAGPMSPSNAFSVSPERDMQRLMAQRGGAANA
ncbi:MAG: hypothetical protein HY323_05435 [Betaproteobacteria bacterium]|nr:hypothetical protein [Betaproteobacteria bacterium]